jgi:predicted DNA-binding protein (MmcQ/YjbR family)
MAAEDSAVNRLRAFCLSLPGSSEASSWGHPNFKTGRRTFAAFERINGRPSIAFRLESIDVDLLLARANFFATPYGRGQWVSIWADGRIGWRLVERLLRRSHHLASATPATAVSGNAPGKKRSRRAKPPSRPHGVRRQR